LNRCHETEALKARSIAGEENYNKLLNSTFLPYVKVQKNRKRDKSPKNVEKYYNDIKYYMIDSHSNDRHCLKRHRTYDTGYSINELDVQRTPILR